MTVQCQQDHSCNRVFMLHLVHVLTSLEYGGVESFALRLLKRLPADQFRSTLVMTTPEKGKRYDDFVSQVQLPVYSCHYQHRRRLRFTWALSKEFKSLKPDIVLSYAFGTHAMVAMASWLARVPRNYVRVAGDPNRHFKKSRMMARLGKPFCNGEIAVSQSTASMLIDKLGLPAGRVHTIVNGCEVEEIRQHAQQARDHRTAQPGIRLLMVSRMDDAKDHETLLEAVARLRQTGRPLELVLAGDGPSRTEHEARATRLGIAEHVQFLGNCPTVHEQLGYADILIHSTRTEGMPNVLLEAMAAQVPIIASDIPPCREVLQDGQCGVLFEKENVSALADAIDSLITQPARQQELKQAAAQRVQTCYHVERMVQQYIQLFQHGQLS